MAVTLTDPRANSIQEVALSATAANSTQMTLHKNERACTVTFQPSAGADDSGKVANTGTDAAAIDDDHQPVNSGGSYRILVAPGRTRVIDGAVYFLTASTASAVAKIEMEW